MSNLPPGFELDAAPPAGFEIDPPHNTPLPGDSTFVKGIKSLGTDLKDALNETGRVAVKTVTGLPLMAQDFGVAARNVASDISDNGPSAALHKLIHGGQYPYELPSATVNSALNSVLPAPTNTRGQISEGLSTLIASLGMPGPLVPQAAKTGLTGADAVKEMTLRQAQAKGLVVPPNQTTNAPLTARILNGWGGKNETNALATARNQAAANPMAAADIGLPPTASMTTQGITNNVIKPAAQQGYAPLRDIGDVPADAAHAAFVKALGASDRGAANIDPTLGNPEIGKLAAALDKPSFKSADMVDAISALRAKATDAFNSGNATLGKAYKQAASGFESLIDRHLQAQGDDAVGKLADFRMSRQMIAKGHDVLDNLNTATGDIDARSLGRSLDDGALSGNLETLGKFGRAFPDVAGRSKGDPNPITAFQANTAGAEGPVSMALNLLGRPWARNKVLSPKVQLALMQPKGKTLSRAALDAVHANPAAFGALYEDQAQ